MLLLRVSCLCRGKSAHTSGTYSARKGYAYTDRRLIDLAPCVYGVSLHTRNFSGDFMYKLRRLYVHYCRLCGVKITVNSTFSVLAPTPFVILSVILTIFDTCRL